MARLGALGRKAWNFLTGHESWAPGWSASLRDLETRIGDPRKSSAVESAVRWTMRNFPEPDLMIEQRGPKGFEPVPDHIAHKLLDNPSPKGSKLSLRHILQQIGANLLLDGNCYIEKIRSSPGSSLIVALEVIPSYAVTVKTVGNSSNILSHYEISTSNRTRVITPENMIHIIDGVNPERTVEGMSAFKALVNEVLTDKEVAFYQYSIMRQPALKGLISPTGPGASNLDEAQAAQVKEGIRKAGANGGAGSIVYVPQGIRLDKISLTPEEMALDRIPRWIEERISAVLGIPAVVLGLGAGLDRATFANFKEAREAAVESFLVPLWGLVADSLTTQLLPEIGGKDAQRIVFNMASVRALSEDEDKRHERARSNFRENLWDRATAISYIGQEPKPTDLEVYAYMLKGSSPLGDVMKEVVKAKAANVPD